MVKACPQKFGFGTDEGRESRGQLASCVHFISKMAVRTVCELLHEKCFLFVASAENATEPSFVADKNNAETW